MERNNRESNQLISRERLTSNSISQSGLSLWQGERIRFWRTISSNKVLLISVLLFFGNFGLVKSLRAAELSIPGDRIIRWQGNVGVPGGIPTSTNYCTTSQCNVLCCNISSSCPSGPPATACSDTGQTVNGTTITDALNSVRSTVAPWGPNYVKVVRLPGGSWSNVGVINILGGNLVLRGAGVGQTTLLNVIIQTNASGGPYGPQGDILSGYTKGSSTVTLGTDVSSVIAPGDFVELTQDPESFMYTDGSTSQIMKQLVYVTAVNTNQMSFSPPLIWGFSSGKNPKYQHYYGAIYPGFPIIGYVGVEDMTLDESGSGFQAGVFLQFVHAPWVKGVEIKNAAIQFSIMMIGTVHASIFGNYLHDGGLGDSGGLLIAGTNSSALVENNRFYKISTSLDTKGNNSSVFAYNYIYDGANYPPINGENRQMPGIITQHTAHEMFDLYEGNIVNMIQNDGYHGSGSHVTLYRNWIHGLDPDPLVVGNRKMVDLDRFSYYHNVIGNVLGDPSWTPYFYQMAGSLGTYQESTIYRLGYPGMMINMYTNDPFQGYGMTGNRCCIDEQQSGGTCANGHGLPGFDPNVQTNLVRHMNFDYYTKSVIQCGDTTYAPEGCQGVTGTTLPASLYLSAKPSWWCNESPWPPIGPDVALGSQANGKVGKIPAQIAYEGGKCTLPNSDTTPPAKPSGLAVN